MNQHGQKILRYLKRDKRFSLVLIEFSKLGQRFVSQDWLIICSTLWSKPMPVHRQAVRKECRFNCYPRTTTLRRSSGGAGWFSGQRLSKPAFAPCLRRRLLDQLDPIVLHDINELPPNHNTNRQQVIYFHCFLHCSLNSKFTNTPSPGFVDTPALA